MRPLILLIIFVFTVAVSFRPLLSARASSSEIAMAEVMYLPNGQGLDFMSFGYRSALAHVLWFNTVSYFGKHYASDQNYRWLAHMCDLVTTLNPKARHVYEFGAIMLAWEVNAPQESSKLLDKAIRNDPEYWRFPYLRGFNAMYFLDDRSSAARDFAHAARLPGAPPMVASLAAKNISVLDDDPQAAVQFLSQVLSSTEDPASRSAIENRLREAQLEVELRLLERAVQMFEEKTGAKPTHLNDLVSSGLVTHLGKDPFGGDYFWDGSTQQIKSTSRKKRFKAFEKK